MLNAGEENKLEAVIDRHGPANVLRSFATIAGEKADHIRDNYGEDDPDAKKWDRLSVDLEKLSAKSRKEIGY